MLPDRMVFRRLFMVLRPNFVLIMVPRGRSRSRASHEPLSCILLDGDDPHGAFGGHLFVQESIHAFDKQSCDALHRGLGCMDAGVARVGAGAGTAARPAKRPAAGAHHQKSSQSGQYFCYRAGQEKAHRTHPETGGFSGLLIDTSGSEQNRLPAEQDAASRFLNQVLRKGDEAMVVSFDLDVDMLSDFTDDRAQLQRAIHHAQINAAGPMVTPGTLPSGPNGTHMYDAIWLICGQKLATEAGRKALVIVTDAEDFGSKVTVNEAIEAAQRANTVVHFLLVHDPGQGWRPDIAASSKCPPKNIFKKPSTKSLRNCGQNTP